MKENGLRTKDKVTEHMFMPMVIHMKVNFFKTHFMDKENLRIQMEMYMRANGKIINLFQIESNINYHEFKRHI